MCILYRLLGFCVEVLVVQCAYCIVYSVSVLRHWWSSVHTVSFTSLFVVFSFCVEALVVQCAYCIVYSVSVLRHWWSSVHTVSFTRFLC